MNKKSAQKHQKSAQKMHQEQITLVFSIIVAADAPGGFANYANYANSGNYGSYDDLGNSDWARG